ncbi:MAG: helix-turn-helix domain-containing protein [Campylobacteraceae bacterium]|jgi:hypothetical protein|nr:helix-turn-helix domain-containing protein [Campylobacteraceae bacterium]
MKNSNQTVSDKKALNQQEAAEYLNLSTSTLKRLRIEGLGAKYIKLNTNTKGKNTKILYPIAELDKWLNSHLQQTA